jgi:leader peptidase (prepilin peptidase) / N-methyltransferase
MVFAPMILAGVMGAMIGSFLNVVAWRLPRGESLVTPGSHCPACDAPVRPYDDVPVLSWLVLRGRCRDCRASISARYPLVEVLTGLVFATVIAARGVDADLVLELPFAAVLIAVAAIDLDHRIVPNKVLVPAAPWAIGAGALVAPDELPERLLAGAIAFAVLLAIVLAYPKGMGMGDVKLAGVMGLFLGAPVAVALLIAFLAGSLVGGAMMVQEGSAARKKALPFAPFLALGGIVALLAGPELVTLYTDRFL